MSVIKVRVLCSVIMIVPSTTNTGSYIISRTNLGISRNPVLAFAGLEEMHPSCDEASYKRVSERY